MQQCHLADGFDDQDV